MKLSGQLAQCNPSMIDMTASLAGVVDTAAMHAKHTAQLGSWIESLSHNRVTTGGVLVALTDLHLQICIDLSVV
ncbi:hypothetical protein [Pseudomonas sp. WS 5011]|uniref:hypothetical protein n=1 Tax=Pseudomonas sp. WS 5011 TaxID=2717477 RepID=UPI0014748F88|nr:hypothetical protein [Pseudomonas sp. WS 5011]NMY53481.1 hypothetical protein [Pseudomonas sp. WS 5011]